MADQVIRSFRDLETVLRERWSDRHVFRGEDSCDYCLKPKYGRFQAVDDRNDLDREQSLLTDFKRYSRPHLMQLPENDWDWLALAQHFGLATRLLDWTENPLVATYFALFSPKPQDRALFMLERSGLEDAPIDVSPFAIEKVEMFRPKHTSPKIAAQASIFTAHPDPTQTYESERLERFVIDKDCVAELLMTLKTFGIHEASMSADLGGLARHLNFLYLHGCNLWP